MYNTIRKVKLIDDVVNYIINKRGRGVMVFNAIFNNISVISWQLVLLVEETVVPVASH